jgi:hypothetical protein
MQLCEVLVHVHEVRQWSTVPIEEIHFRVGCLPAVLDTTLTHSVQQCELRTSRFLAPCKVRAYAIVGGTPSVRALASSMITGFVMAPRRCQSLTGLLEPSYMPGRRPMLCACRHAAGHSSHLNEALCRSGNPSLMA